MRWSNTVGMVSVVLTLAACGSSPAAPAPGTTTGSPLPPSSSAPSAGGPTSTTQPPRPASRPTAPPRLRTDVLGRVLERLPTSRRVVALTFDAGANNAGVAEILRVLHDTAAPGTFFLTGRWAQLYPADARLIASRYPVGNHTQSHPNLTTLSIPHVRAQIAQARRRIITITGRDPHPLFRFPYGADDAPRLAVVNGLGYAAVGWTVDTLGWEGRSQGQSASSVLARVLAGLTPGEIVLMHVGSNPTDHTTLDADALRSVVEAVRARGYALTTVPPYLFERPA
jgi:peptidoglycan/xylan/chitin deacetylase (PgdA/CDA1 family)